MRKRYVLLFVALLSICLSSCSPKAVVNQQIIIDSGKYFNIYETDAHTYYYEVYNSHGDTVISDSTDGPITIHMITDDVVDISVGKGTGIAVHVYVDVETNDISSTFSYVAANADELIAYMDVPSENSFVGRKLIVQNIFDKDSFYREYPLDFSPVDTPVISASFSDDASILTIRYLRGNDPSEVSKDILLREAS